MQGKILSATITKEADRWFVSLTVEQEIADPQPIQGGSYWNRCWINLFCNSFKWKQNICSKAFSKYLKRLKKASKNHSRKIVGSNNRRKSALKLSRIHRKVRNIRKDFLHKETTKLAKTKSVIVLEDLNVKEMMSNKRLSRQISDVGWSEFRRMLEYKTKWYGSKLIVAPRFYPSSKTCSECGALINELPLSNKAVAMCRMSQCHHDRDVNAAKNLLNWSTGSSPGIYACGDTSDGARQKLV